MSTKNLFFAVHEWATGTAVSEETMPLKSLSTEEMRALKEEMKNYDISNPLAQKPLHMVLSELKTSTEHGISSARAQEALDIHGKNELDSDPPPHFCMLFAEQFNDILVIMLIGACIVSLSLGQYAAGTTIVIIVMFNAILGAIQEHGAGAAMDALAALQSSTASVIRDGNLQKIDGSLVVPGDLVVFNTGDSVVADTRMTEVQDLEANEASLTGESESVRKQVEVSVPKKNNKKETSAPSDAEAKEEGKEEEEQLTLSNVVYMGTEVTNGKGKGIVIHTGMTTKMGLLAERLKNVDAGASPLKGKLGKLGVRLGLASLSVSIIIFIVGVSTGRGGDPTSGDPLWLQMLLIAVSLTVAAVPEGLPVCVTLCLANGMQNMTKKQALVRKLASVETLGSTTIICTDKTGTLTCGKMTTVRMWTPGQLYKVTGQGYNPEGAVFPVDEKTQSDIPGNASELYEQVKKSGVLKPVAGAFLLCSDASVELDDVEIKEGGVSKTVKQWVGKGNATERALVVGARKLGLERKELYSDFKEVAQNPFSSKRKMMSVLLQVSEAKGNMFGTMTNNTEYVAIAKGAPNRIIGRCSHYFQDGKVIPMSEEDKKNALNSVNMLSSQALRVLAVGIRGFPDHPDDTSDMVLENHLVFLGLNAAIDPERPEVTVAIAKAKGAGVETVMITGDYLATARAIAENIGLLEKGNPKNEEMVMDCKGLRKLGTDITNLEKALREGGLIGGKRKDAERRLGDMHVEVDEITKRTKVYARAEPFDKITIVESYKRQGHVACMTGDGVNDAAALQGANIGVAMGSGTDVAKGAADMVLLDDSFATIVAAIEEGRKIYANITKFVFFLLSTNVAEVFLILIALLMGLQSPLAPIQILWLNLCTDGAPAVALALERAEPGIMDEGPRPLTEPILEKIQLTGITIQTFFETAFCLITYIVGLLWNTESWNGNNPHRTDDENKSGIRRAQTMVIYLIVFLELLRAYTSRALRTSVFSMGVFSNTAMQYAVFVSVGATLFVGNVPVIQEIFSMTYLSGREWGLVLGLTPICAIIDEITKVVYRATGFGERPKIAKLELNKQLSIEIKERLGESGGGSVPLEVIGNNENRSQGVSRSPTVAPDVDTIRRSTRETRKDSGGEIVDNV